jgi:hypothetical protein
VLTWATVVACRERRLTVRPVGETREVTVAPATPPGDATAKMPEPGDVIAYMPVSDGYGVALPARP